MLKMRRKLRFFYRDSIGSGFIAGQGSEFLLTRRQVKAFGDLFVSRKTDIVIEGFPRSGANFLAAAANQALNRDLRISYRRHCVCQIKAAKKYTIPCFILIRNPSKCIASCWIATDGAISLDRLIQYYINYYDKVLKLNYGEFFDADKMFNEPDFYIRIISENIKLSRIKEVSFEDVRRITRNKYKILEHINGRSILAREAPTPSISNKTAHVDLLERVTHGKNFDRALEIYEHLKCSQ